MGLHPDDRVGNYRIERELGSRATYMLYTAVHVVLPRRAVIKVAHDHVVPSCHAVQMLREACLVEALQHPGVPQIYESGLLPDRRAWFAVEHIEGVTLAERLATGAMSAVAVATTLSSIAAILEHAQRRGVVHAGLRPDRVVLAETRVRFPICIPDWSVAHTHDTAVAAPRIPAPVARHYVAPEQIRGDAVDDRTDIYALGVIGYQALTGALPRATPDTPHISTRERRPDTPRELAKLVDSMLSFDGADRPAASEVRAGLALLIDVMTGPAVEALEEVQIDVDLVDTDGIPASRSRELRWTPDAPYITSEQNDVVAGEIIGRIAKPKRS